MNIDTSYNFRRVNESITTSGLVDAVALEALSAQGYAVVINLLPDTYEHAVRNEREIVESQGIEYIHIPVDFKKPERPDFLAFAEALDRVADKKIHLHCAANYRVSAFYALYQRRRGHWSIDKTMAFIEEIWRPAEHEGWSDFIEALLDDAK